MSRPVAYLRKSRVIDERNGVSWEVQEAKVRELAAKYGDNGGRLLILSDWNVSGRKSGKARPGYRELVRMIETREASAVYSYNMARLSRSTHDLLELVALAAEDKAKGRTEIPIRLVADQFDTTTATGRMLLTVLAAVDEMTADLASEHAKDAVQVRRARGDRIGHPFYGEKPGEDASAVIRAYQQAGSVLGAGKLLNEWKVKTRMGGPWGSTTVRATLVRLGAMPLRTRPGAKPSAPFMFYGLLRCHCGHILTGSRFRNGKDTGYTNYKCHIARTMPGHGLSAVPEKRALAWAKIEAARLQVPPTAEMESSKRADERERLDQRRVVIEDMYEANGPTWRGEYLRRLAALKADEDALAEKEAATALVAVPQAIDWTAPPENINNVLRAIWRSIEFDSTMQPTAADWIVPEWRS